MKPTSYQPKPRQLDRGAAPQESERVLHGEGIEFRYLHWFLPTQGIPSSLHHRFSDSMLRLMLPALR